MGRDIDRHGGSASAVGPGRLELGISGHHESDRATAEAEGNGRTGLQLKLTVKQVSIVLGIVATLAGGTVAVSTWEPGKPDEHHKTAPRNDGAVDLRVDAITRAIEAHAEDLASVRSDVRDTHQEVRELRGDVRDLRAAVSALERAVSASRGRARGEGGGAK